MHHRYLIGKNLLLSYKIKISYLLQEIKFNNSINIQSSYGEYSYKHTLKLHYSLNSYFNMHFY